MEGILREQGVDALNMKDAAAASGYSAEYLGRLVRDGKIANAGRPKAPKILRRDLPRKAPTDSPRDRASSIMHEAVLSRNS